MEINAHTWTLEDTYQLALKIEENLKAKSARREGSQVRGITPHVSQVHATGSLVNTARVNNRDVIKRKTPTLEDRRKDTNQAHLVKVTSH